MGRRAQGSVPAVFLSLAALVAGCSTPMSRTANQVLRRSVVESTQRELAEARQSPQAAPPAKVPDRLGFSDDRLRELDSISGVGSYGSIKPPLGPDLLGRATKTVGLSLQQAITRAIRHNLSAQLARLDDSATQSDIVAAQALFDWTFFADASFQIVDRPSVVPIIGSVPIGTGFNRNRTLNFDAGLRRQLTTGGRVQLQQTLNIFNNQSLGRRLAPDPSRTTRLDLSIDQPLLRGFGSDVTLAQVRLSRNLDRATLEALRATLITTATETERAYWNLVRASRDAQIQAKLLARGIKTRDVLADRLSFDVHPAEYSDAVAQVEDRRANLIRALNTLRKSSDDLKVLLNDPEFPVGAEDVLLPVDEPTDAALGVSLLDSLETAFAQRPDVQQAILAIDDATIRETVADNARLPRLDLRLAASLSGQDNSATGSFANLGSAKFVDSLAGLTFEQPLGNRAAEAGFRRARLQRMRSVVAYRATVQRAVADVKAAMRDIATNHQLIGQTRIARLAAAENVRTLLVEEKNLRGLTPDFLDLKLRRQEALATAESAEIRALVEYNIAIADLFGAAGSTLERNGVRIRAPEFENLPTPAPTPTNPTATP